MGVIYGAVLAFAQSDLKRLVAYTSVSHMGFVLIGTFAWNTLALQGVVMQIICHALSTGALFILVGALYERTQTRDLRRLGGLWSTVPRLGALGMFFAMASLGLPGLGNFVAEFLILVGAFASNVPATVAATAGLALATVYSLWVVQRVFHGANEGGWALVDLSVRELVVLGAMVVILLWLGLHPQVILDTAAPSLAHLQQSAVW
jgi:NADH-quinone oxidoreductase subunit M